MISTKINKEIKQTIATKINPSIHETRQGNNRVIGAGASKVGLQRVGMKEVSMATL